MRQVHGLSEDGSTITLHHFGGGVQCDPMTAGEPTKTLLVVDVETTGLDPKTDVMIEFAAAELRYTDDGRIVQHVDTYSWLEDPGRPLPPEITEITGLRDDDLNGKQIPARAEELIADADLIVSHNAAFDWAFARQRWPDAVDEKVWGCSFKQIDWSGLGFPAAKQELLTRFHGFFYDAHRAETDVEALVKLLQMRPERDAPTYLKQLLDYLKDTRYRVLAVGTPYAAKDELKQRGYHWDGERRVWWTTARKAEAEAEKQWLGELYQAHRCRAMPLFQKIDPRQQWA